MSSPSSAPPPPEFFDGDQKMELSVVRELVSVINRQMHSLLQNAESRRALKLAATYKLRNLQPQEFFEFSEHSVLSNLYWGIEASEAAAVAECAGERAIKLANSEKMLQIPASLDEDGCTLGIPNNSLVCCSYFYLSVVEFLRKNDWQSAVHFLQAVLVSPRLVYSKLAPGVCRSLFPLFIEHDGDNLSSSGCLINGVLSDNAGIVDQVLKWIAKRFKPWLMYYRIMAIGDSTQENIATGIEFQHLGGNEDSLSPDHDLDKICPKEKEVVEDNSCCIASERSSSSKFLRDILTESESDSPVSGIPSVWDDLFPQDDVEDPNTSRRMSPTHHQLVTREKNVKGCIPQSFSSTFCMNDVPKFGLRHMEKLSYFDDDGYEDHSGSISMKKDDSLETTKNSSSCGNGFHDVHLHREENFVMDQNDVLQRIVSKLCYTEEIGDGVEESGVEMKTIYEILNSKKGLKYSILKDIILDQLLISITTSKEERTVRTSVSILSTIATANKSVVEDIKRKGLQLYDLATALKRNVHEAVVLIYLINPSPAEIKTLELLPCLVEVVCASKYNKLDLKSLLLTPPAASLMIMDSLVTAFDYETNSMHLAAISSPRVLSRLLQVPRKDNLEEFISLASILVKCMRFDEKSRKCISEISPVAPFVGLLWSNQRRASSVALEYFSELHKIPRSSAITLLQQIQRQGSTNNMSSLFMLMHDAEPEIRLLSANLLLQLEALEEAPMKSIYREEAADVLFNSLTCEEGCATEIMSAFIISNLGGTYSWSGEPYTTAWLLRKTGLTSARHWNLIKKYDFLDECLQDGGIDSWCSKIAQRLLLSGATVFHALDKGLRSRSRRLSRDCLVAAAWISCELVKCQDEQREDASEIILHSIEQFLHPGFELEERLLACLCIYNYSSGRGIKKLATLSDGVRESLRRLSNATWMAEELLSVADYFQPNKGRISCVHSQILEMGNKSCGAVTALIFYKGLLYSGYADGSIKAWEIKGQAATLVQEMQEHRKSVTCFALHEPGNCLLSASADKTIKMWQMRHLNLECIEVIPMKESVKLIESSGDLIFAATQGHKLKVIDTSRKIRDVFKNKKVKCIRAVQGKVYVGCVDSSIQELMIINNRQQEIKRPSKSWVQTKPITSVSIYKNWLYCSSSSFEGSSIKDWRRSTTPQISTVPDKGGNILAMEVVEDFVYLNCSTSVSSIQIWLRGTQHKVGRLSAGSKITSLLTANDMILCGNEKGVIKGWIPL